MINNCSIWKRGTLIPIQPKPDFHVPACWCWYVQHPFDCRTKSHHGSLSTIGYVSSGKARFSLFHTQPIALFIIDWGGARVAPPLFSENRTRSGPLDVASGSVYVPRPPHQIHVSAFCLNVLFFFFQILDCSYDERWVLSVASCFLARLMISSLKFPLDQYSF